MPSRSSLAFQGPDFDRGGPFQAIGHVRPTAQLASQGTLDYTLVRYTIACRHVSHTVLSIGSFASSTPMLRH